MLVTLLLLALSFVLIVVGAYTFTNSLEWAGVRLGLEHGAVGSVLAAVATALPESTIPVIAIISGEEGGQVAIGAIIGAPLLLATLGMVVVGLTAVVTRKHREHGIRLDVDRPSTVRELAVFLVLLSIALVLGVVGAGFAVRVAPRSCSSSAMWRTCGGPSRATVARPTRTRRAACSSIRPNRTSHATSRSSSRSS